MFFAECQPRVSDLHALRAGTVVIMSKTTVTTTTTKTKGG